MRRVKVDLSELVDAMDNASLEMRYYLDVETGEVLLLMDDDDDEELAERIEEGFGTRYVEVPQAQSSDGYRDMQAFIETVQDQRFQKHLWRAIEGRGAFRRFKDTLLDEPAERERWFAFQAERQRERVLEWLAGEGIEVDTEAQG